MHVSVLSGTLDNAIERQHLLLNHASDVTQCKFLDLSFPAGLPYFFF